MITEAPNLPPSRESTTVAPDAATLEPPAARERLVSLDAFRGAVMLLMASSGFGIAAVARKFPESAWWNFLGVQFEHVEWTGCTPWDLIQPAFMFTVGVALPWSIAKRTARGDRFRTLLAHALSRSMTLVALAVFLTSAWSARTQWIFTNVLAQIGLGYPFLFLLAFTRTRTLWFSAGGILAGYWLLFALYPISGSHDGAAAGGLPAAWPHLAGFAAHWEKNANFAAAFDRWFLNLFPRASPFAANAGGYQTLNFIPSLATMILGLIVGRLLRERPHPEGNVRRLVLGGLAGIAAGALLHALGICPIVKRIWTPSWVLFSGGLVSLALALFIVAVDRAPARRWAFPLVVAGLNPISLYCMWQLTGGFIRDAMRTHFGPGFFALFGALYAPILERVCILLVFWLILFGMYKKRIFIRV